MSMRLALLDAQTMDNIQRDLASGVGGDACMMAEKEATRIVTGSLLAGIKGRLTRYGAIKKRALEDMEEYSLLLGMGRIEMERFTPGEGGALKLHKPFDLMVTAAGVTGALEEMDRCRYRTSISSLGEHDYRLVLEVSESEDPEVSLSEPSSWHGRGGEKVRGCSLCGLPLAFSQLLWDELYGTVEAGIQGRRVAFLPAYMLSVLARLGKGEVEGGQAGLVERAVYASTVNGLERGRDDAYESTAIVPRNGNARIAWGSMAMRGWGEVVGGALRGREWRIDVLDPVDMGLVAGWLRALYTLATGEDTATRIEEGRESTTFSLG